MRISDWSSDVCSSDLALVERTRLEEGVLHVDQHERCVSQACVLRSCVLWAWILWACVCWGGHRRTSSVWVRGSTPSVLGSCSAAGSRRVGESRRSGCWTADESPGAKEC